jgi:hypothetical protein
VIGGYGDKYCEAKRILCLVQLLLITYNSTRNHAKKRVSEYRITDVLEPKRTEHGYPCPVFFMYLSIIDELKVDWQIRLTNGSDYGL